MRLVKLLLIEAIEISEVMRVQTAALKRGDAFGDLAALSAHAPKLPAPRTRPKPIYELQMPIKGIDVLSHQGDNQMMTAINNDDAVTVSNVAAITTQ